MVGHSKSVANARVEGGNRIIDHIDHSFCITPDFPTDLGKMQCIVRAFLAPRICSPKITCA